MYKAFGQKYRTFMHWYNTDCYFVDFKSWKQSRKELVVVGIFLKMKTRLAIQRRWFANDGSNFARFSKEQNYDKYKDIEAIRHSDIFTAVMMIVSDLARMPIRVTVNGQINYSDRIVNLLVTRLMKRRTKRTQDSRQPSCQW